MVLEYTILSEAYEAIVKGNKRTEIRAVNSKKVSKGDYIHFQELGGNRSINVLVDEVLSFADLDVLRQHIPDVEWSFEPKQKLEQLVVKEFFPFGESVPVMAIRFHPVLLTVIMPAFNVAEHLKETLDCIASQTNRDFEVIFLDDHSSDQTVPIARSFEHVFPLRIIEHSEHQGVSNLRNRGLAMAERKYVMFLDSDDLFEPSLFNAHIHALETSSADISMAEFDSFDSSIGYHGCNQLPVWSGFFREKGNQMFRWEEIPECYIHGTNVPWNKMFRRSFLQRTDLWYQNIPCSADVYFCHMAMIYGIIIHVEDNRTLIHYRVGRKGAISNSHDCFSEIEAYKKILIEIKGMKQEVQNKVLDDFLYGMMKHVRISSESNRKDFYRYVRQEILINHQFFSESFLRKNHPMLPELLQPESGSDLIFSVNYMLIVFLEKRRNELSKLFSELEHHDPVGLIHNGPNEEFFLRYADNNKITWCLGEECGTVRPKVILCLNPMDLTDISAFVKKYRLSETRIVPVYAM